MGEVTILDNHESLVSIVEKGTMKIVDKDQKEWYIPVSSGFLEVNSGSQVKILVEEEKS
jgi:F0F1-type ATP synthase epsilon subunit